MLSAPGYRGPSTEESEKYVKTTYPIAGNKMPGYTAVQQYDNLGIRLSMLLQCSTSAFFFIYLTVATVANGC